MRRPVFLLLLILLQITLPVKLSGQKPDYRLFDNISLGTEASVINCFLQDTQGLIWIGSNKGLFSYDGYSTQPHFTFAKRNNTQIYCGTVVDSTYLYLGADNGLLIYNYRTDTYFQNTENASFADSDYAAGVVQCKEAESHLIADLFEGPYLLDSLTTSDAAFDAEECTVTITISGDTFDYVRRKHRQKSGKH